MKFIKAARGMQDFLPDEVQNWQKLERTLIQVAKLYGYQEVRFPIIENKELFIKSLGETSDVVAKEMYSFINHNENLSLRPEGTASVVRLGLEYGLLHNQKQRFFYFGPMFRRERPQKGRYRQFHQFGVEAFGYSGIEIELEQLLLVWRWWRVLGIHQDVVLEINSLGEQEERNRYRQALIDYFQPYSSSLSETERYCLTRNPLRLLDSKNSSLQDMLDQAPKILTYLSQASQERLENLAEKLTALNLPYKINQKLVRGLDYYNQTVFEWKLLEDRQQNTVCAGGRYDRLVADRGGNPTPAFGFALGMERLISLINFTPVKAENIYWVMDSWSLIPWKMVEELRSLGYKVVVEIGVKMANIYKRAELFKASLWIHVQVKCKVARVEKREELEIPVNQLVEFLKKELHYE